MMPPSSYFQIPGLRGSAMAAAGARHYGPTDKPSREAVCARPGHLALLAIALLHSLLLLTISVKRTE